jgi:hypothetical protein
MADNPPPPADVVSAPEPDKGAIFSPCRTWRYLLWRNWDLSLPACAFIGLNPSTADETLNRSH